MSVHGAQGRELLDRVGSLAQVARVDKLVEDDGAARGARRFRMVTGGGLEVEVHPDRCLDLGQVTIDGIPVAWISAGGIGSPWSYDPHGRGWLRSFGGGLLTTCGLDTFGAPSIDDGVSFGQHGRVSSTPAQVLSAGVDGDRLLIEGLVRQSAHLGENLTLRRRLESCLGSTELTVRDVVTNESSVASAHMMMYHLNVGWPLVDADATLDVPSSLVEPREPGSAVTHWRSFEDPAPGLRDEVFLHHFADDAPDIVVSRLENRRIGVFLEVEQDRRRLPWTCQWKMMSADAYVVGIEPVNTPTMVGRADAHERGVLPVLAPGASVEYVVRIRLGRTDRAGGPGPASPASR